MEIVGVSKPTGATFLEASKMKLDEEEEEGEDA